MKDILIGTQLPTHHDLGADCCGFFNDLRDTGLYCNGCGMEISEFISEFYNEVVETLRSMWGGTKQGVFMNFNGCETDAKEKWLALSKKMGIFGDV